MNPPGIAPAGLLVTDLFLVICLLALCAAWLWRGLRRRTPVLWVGAAGAVVPGAHDGQPRGATLRDGDRATDRVPVAGRP